MPVPLLDDVIRRSIYEYPTLYRDVDWERSRIKVLGHMFLCIGTGLEWCREGWLYDECSRTGKPRASTLAELPPGFFERELWAHSKLTPEQEKSLPTVLGDTYHYIERRSGQPCLMFEAPTERDAQEILTQLGVGENEHAAFFREMRDNPDRVDPVSSELRELCDRMSRPFAMRARACEGYTPYPISEYSPVREILEGRTNSLAVENFELTPDPGWLQGAVTICEYAQAYYLDEERCREHHSHWEQTLPQYKQDLRDAKKGKKLWWRLKGGETVTQFAKRHWEKHKREQLRFLKRFLKKFGT
ncbi:MAG TPA: hypothetical protein VM493_01280 [Vicinamibacterales bacterium]|jgi:hypothetical protein|nr:hypothetical protein [Vicinamibacterales bacterium]